MLSKERHQTATGPTCPAGRLEAIQDPYIEIGLNAQVDEPHAWLADPVADTVEFVGRDIETWEVNAELDRRIEANFIFNGSSFDCDNASRQSTSMAASTGQGFDWIDAQNVTHAFSAADMQSMNSAVVTHLNNHMLSARAMKDANTIPSDYSADGYWP